MKAASSPAEVRPEITSWPPIHSMTPMAAITISITKAIKRVRCLMRLTATPKATSTRSVNSNSSRASWLKDCTIFTCRSDSPAWVPTSASRSWLLRDRRRTRRPRTRIGATTKGALTSTTKVSFGLDNTSNTTPPMNISRFLSAMETDEPITVCSKVVSVVMRLWISVGRFSSKKAGCSRMRCLNTASRMSALTRSPIQDTK